MSGAVAGTPVSGCGALIRPGRDVGRETVATRTLYAWARAEWALEWWGHGTNEHEGGCMMATPAPTLRSTLERNDVVTQLQRLTAGARDAGRTDVPGWLLVRRGVILKLCASHGTTAPAL